MLGDEPRRRIERYKENLQDEHTAPTDRLEALYSEAQVVQFATRLRFCNPLKVYFVAKGILLEQ